MKTIAKVAVGFTAVAMVVSAFAGGPEMAPPTINGFNMGLGFGYNSYVFDQRQGDLTGGNRLSDNKTNSRTHFGPVGEIGYTFQVNHLAFVGLRAFWQYDHYRTRVAGAVYEYGTDLQSHLAAMFVAGILLNSSNAAYVEAGYTAMWAKMVAQAEQNPGQVLPASTKYTLHGGIAGVGWRHYFANNVYLDMSYNFALYADDKTELTLPANINGDGPAFLSGIKKLQINGITATLNYLFQV